MEFLFSNFEPLKTTYDSFSKKFYSLLSESNRVDIAVGYITAESLIELKNIFEKNTGKHLRLIIGMHFLERFTKAEYELAKELHVFLGLKNRGAVKLVTPFRYHGKMYVFQNDGDPVAAIIGSNNLSSIIDSNNRIYEASAIIYESGVIKRMLSFIDSLDEGASEDLDALNINDFKKNNPLLANHEHVAKVSSAEVNRIKNNLTENQFTIPLKDTPKSNLNVYFGEGRRSRNGLIKPRHWYEVELIVPKDITSQTGYPQASTDSCFFTVITDDRWSFDCKVSGTNSKNFRSASDLKILGKWLKGRLEQNEALKIGEKVTRETFEKYGRADITLTETRDRGKWFLDFGVD